MNLQRLRENVRTVRSRIRRACRNVGREASAVKLIAVTKGRSAEMMRELLDLGIRHIGENRVQEAEGKRPKIPEGPVWHMVGHLQSNKVKRAIRAFDVIHSVDRQKLAEELHRALSAEGRRMKVFVQVNVAREPQKHGVAPEETLAFVDVLREKYRTLEPIGLMTLAPLSREPERSRPHFAALRELAVRCGLQGLSMGMSQDYVVAIEEGATHLRIGSALFAGVNDE